MLIVGLTGSIGMGKSTIAKQLSVLGAKTISADDIVHKLLSTSGEAFTKVATLFPEAVNNNKIDRKKLGEIVFSNDKKMQELEKILHPLVIREEEKYCRAQKKLGAKLLVLDIPLLFETGGERRVDKVIVATSPYFIQKARVLSRPNMTERKFAEICKKQMPDSEKRKRADFIIHTGLGKVASMRQIKEWLFYEKRNNIRY